MTVHNPTSYITEVPKEMASYPQWVVWKLESSQQGGKPSKIPYDPRTGQRASSVGRLNWVDHKTAVKTFSESKGQYAGIGFVFTEHDPFVFLDLDGCYNSATQEWTNAAADDFYRRFKLHTTIEVSQSGKGVHIIGQLVDKPAFVNRRRKFLHVAGEASTMVECYTIRRFMAISGKGFVGAPAFTLDNLLLPLVAELGDEYFSSNGEIDFLPRDPEWSGPDDDVELIRRALTFRGNRSVETTFFGAPSKATFADYWNGTKKAIEEHDGDLSSVDLALMNWLAWLTGKDGQRMIALFSQSELGLREKWQKRQDYQIRTARAAISGVQEVYSGNQLEQRQHASQIANAPYVPADRMDISKLSVQFQTVNIAASDTKTPDRTLVLSLAEMRERFVLITGLSPMRVVDLVTKTPNIINDMRVRFSASMHEVVDEKASNKQEGVDANTTPRKLVSAFDCWLNDRHCEAGEGRKEANAISWRPSSQTFIQLPEGTGRGVNMWRGFYPLHAPLDWENRVKPFIDFFKYLFPNEAEHKIAMQFFAHIIQCPDQLPSIALVHISEKQGTGRGLLSKILNLVMRGYVTNADINKLLGDNFNGRLSQKLLCIVEEAQAVGDMNKRWSHAETLKTIITEANREINIKHGTQSVEYNRMRLFIQSNHSDPVPFGKEDRRLYIIQGPGEVANDDYYLAMYALADDPDFIASVFYFLATIPIQDFNPNMRAPMTAKKVSALQSSRSQTEQDFELFIDDFPGPLTTTDVLNEYITAKAGQGRVPSSAAIKHAREAAGILDPDKKIKLSGGSTRVQILRDWNDQERTVGYDKMLSSLTVEAVKSADANVLREILDRASTEWNARHTQARAVSVPAAFSPIVPAPNN